MLVLEIAVELLKEGRVQLHLPALYLVPRTVWGGMLDAVIYPPDRNVVCNFIVQDRLEGGDDLKGKE